jgi:hypothetical protein
VLIAIAGVVLMWKRQTWREKLLLSWILVPGLFFWMWPVKGFQYLLPLAPAVALLAARAIVLWMPRSRKLPTQFYGWGGRSAIAAIVAISMFVMTWGQIQPSQASTFLAGSGGVPGGRQAGLWIRSHVPAGAQIMTVGPSMANIIEFYGHRQCYGLAVSPNPLHRNPSYQPVDNPDLEIRHDDLQYLIWDSFSASRSPFFSQHMLTYAHRYNGRIVHVETVPEKTKSGATVNKPIIIIYQVRP